MHSGNCEVTKEVPAVSEIDIWVNLFSGGCLVLYGLDSFNMINNFYNYIVKNCSIDDCNLIDNNYVLYCNAPL